MTDREPEVEAALVAIERALGNEYVLRHAGYTKQFIDDELAVVRAALSARPAEAASVEEARLTVIAWLGGKQIAEGKAGAFTADIDALIAAVRAQTATQERALLGALRTAGCCMVTDCWHQESDHVVDDEHNGTACLWCWDRGASTDADEAESEMVRTERYRHVFSRESSQ